MARGVDDGDGTPRGRSGKGRRPSTAVVTPDGAAGRSELDLAAVRDGWRRDVALEIWIEETTVRCIRLTGVLDTTTVAALRGTVEGLLDEGWGPATIDPAALDVADEVALRALAELERAVAGPTPRRVAAPAP
jgi:hypothetical protein